MAKQENTEAISEQIEYLQKIIEQMQTNLEEISKLKQDINDIGELKKDEEILAPIANGIFITAKIKDAKTFKVNVGQGVVVKKTAEETINLLEKQEKEIISSREEALSKLEQLYAIAYGRQRQE
jgi:prefoldin alpha subunit